ncbi:MULTISPECIES: RNA methyltransferase [unclassified Meiothermus]|uniref:RNA methyltransferase n=1 Tax=unclassified Meiothermus TaxID=370471 RepID=UPI000D7C75E3|nr:MULTISPECIES: RNA methyltransferase [unclassified Meiothermus]PZA07393.1 RNA methyltransferase [Meiothermus sp. Pnk-1]RYM29208.1 RNA methyltransferase [Meiothermus sp. PNK-Is4]
MSASLLDSIRVVLVGPQEPMNVGATARAMRNFGLSDLWLVAPEPSVAKTLDAPLDPKAYHLAVRAEEILDRAHRSKTLLEAVRDCVLVVGTTVRSRDVYTGPLVSPRALAPEVLKAAQKGKVALVFGRETFGLTNQELELSQWVLRIPTAPEQTNLNLAQAVLLVAYELFLQAENPPEPPADQPAPRGDLEALFADLESYVLEIGFTDPRRLPYTRRRLRRILHKATLSEAEAKMLRGFLHQSRWYARHKDKAER